MSMGMLLAMLVTMVTVLVTKVTMMVKMLVTKVTMMVTMMNTEERKCLCHLLHPHQSATPQLLAC